MAKLSIAAIKAFFNTADLPTESQFASFIDTSTSKKIDVSTGGFAVTQDFSGNTAYHSGSGASILSTINFATLVDNEWTGYFIVKGVTGNETASITIGSGIPMEDGTSPGEVITITPEEILILSKIEGNLRSQIIGKGGGRTITTGASGFPIFSSYDKDVIYVPDAFSTVDISLSNFNSWIDNKFSCQVIAENITGTETATVIAQGTVPMEDGTLGAVQGITVSDVAILSKINGKLRIQLVNYSTGGGGGAVDSVFGRTGAVAAVSGDYTTGQVTAVTDKNYTTDAELLEIAANTARGTIYPIGSSSNLTDWFLLATMTGTAGGNYSSSVVSVYDNLGNSSNVILSSESDSIYRCSVIENKSVDYTPTRQRSIGDVLELLFVNDSGVGKLYAKALNAVSDSAIYDMKLLSNIELTNTFIISNINAGSSTPIGTDLGFNWALGYIPQDIEDKVNQSDTGKTNIGHTSFNKTMNGQTVTADGGFTFTLIGTDLISINITVRDGDTAATIIFDSGMLSEKGAAIPNIILNETEMLLVQRMEDGNFMIR